MANIDFSNVATCQVRNAAPLDRDNLAEILDMAPRWGWSVSTEYKAGYVWAKFAGERAGRKRYAYQHDLSTPQMHLSAALQFIRQAVPECESFRLIATHSRSESGYVFTFL